MATNTLFRLKRPCANCPFRADDQAIDLAPGRIESIAEEITSGDGLLFYCHKTLSGDRDHDDEDGYEPGASDSVCAGSLIFQMKAGRVPIPARFAFMTDREFPNRLSSQFDSVIDPEDVL
ncbi:hypothetical protein TW86_04120 [Halomonas sp. S2151]|uniref:hypothetical protein n=1 Tax=Halomonas sp. S2151 TaxID=579478 RepID=UPI0005FA215D|nr:hypothetical protein [Halomonas sp. S2151]KJZ17445.1 hypothetical protein TW86_04120 [Halomonas sp. S2151]